MKKPIKWFVTAGLLILVIVCIEVNLNKSAYLPGDESLVDIINIATLSLFLILILRFIVRRHKGRAGNNKFTGGQRRKP